MAKKSKAHSISASMHYTVVIALIVSLITTFLLGMLLTETLLNGGFSYFDEVRREASLGKANAQMMDLNKVNTNEFVPPGQPSPKLVLANVLDEVRTEGSATYYDFDVSITNTGNTDFKRFVMTYDYDRDLFEYVDQGSVAIGEKGFNFFHSLWTPTPAHAQVSIDFPMFFDDKVECDLRTNHDPAKCRIGNGSDRLEPGETWTVPITLELTDDNLGYAPSWLKKAFVWIFPQKANAQISIDFPTTFYSETTATIIEAVDENNWRLIDPISSEAVFEIE